MGLDLEGALGRPAIIAIWSRVKSCRAVISLSCGSNAIGAVTEIDLVQVQLEDLFLVELVLNSEGEENLAQLAQIGLLAAQEEVACDLHGDGAAALALLAGADEIDHRAQDALIVDAGVFEETVVLSRQHRLDHQIRHVLVAYRHAAHLSEFGEKHAVPAVHAHWHLKPDVAQGFDGGQVGRDYEPGGSDRDSADDSHAGDSEDTGEKKFAHEARTCGVAGMATS
jgi:hypothetical protein